MKTGKNNNNGWQDVLELLLIKFPTHPFKTEKVWVSGSFRRDYYSYQSLCQSVQIFWSHILMQCSDEAVSSAASHWERSGFDLTFIWGVCKDVVLRSKSGTVSHFIFTKFRCKETFFSTTQKLLFTFNIIDKSQRDLIRSLFNEFLCGWASFTRHLFMCKLLVSFGLADYVTAGRQRLSQLGGCSKCGRPILHFTEFQAGLGVSFVAQSIPEFIACSSKFQFPTMAANT